MKYPKYKIVMESNTKTRNRLSPEDIFLMDVKRMIRNLLIDNPNYKSDYYFKESDTMNCLKLMRETKERAQYILNRIDEIDHLIKFDNEE